MSFITLLPVIFKAIRKFSALFSKGRELVKSVTNSDSVASTPEDLEAEIQQLPPEFQAQWAEAMAQEIEMYKAQNERLELEIGTVDDTITDKIDQETANEVARMRMTTRPWAVRYSMYLLLFPFFLIGFDIAQYLVFHWIVQPIYWLISLCGCVAISAGELRELIVFNTFDYAFGIADLNQVKEIAAQKAGFLATITEVLSLSMFGIIYKEAVPWATSIVLGYMGLREVGKAAGRSDNPNTPDRKFGDGKGAAMVQNVMERASNIGGGKGKVIKDTISNIVEKNKVLDNAREKVDGIRKFFKNINFKRK